MVPDEVPDSDSTYRFFIDYPTATSLPGFQTVIAGWCLRQDGAPITAVRALLEASCHYGRCGIPRPDVERTLGLSSGARSGFEIVVAIPPGPNEYRLEAQTSDGKWSEFARVRIKASVRGETLSKRGNILTPLLERFYRYPFAVFDPNSAFRLCIERPVSTRLGSLRLVVSGWCFHRGGLRITGVGAIFRGITRQGRFGIPRPDVALIHGLGTEASGFEIGLELPPGCTDCELEAELEDGTRHRFRSLHFTSPSPAIRKERLRWMRFWRTAVKGDPSAWDIVTESEREYLLFMAGRRGLLSIGSNRQHEPRPIRIETYPTARLTTDDMPCFTIVTPSFNHADFLEATMRSVLDQPDVRIDYIVQDGASTDGSPELIQQIAMQYAKPDRLARLLRWSSEPDAGQADAIRRGFDGTHGGADDLMAFLNSDDVFMPNALRLVAEFFATHPEVDVIYGHRVIIDESGLEIGRWYSPRTDWDDMRFFDLIPQETLFWRRRIWNRVGGIDVTFQYALDWDLILRFQAAGARFARLPWFIGQFRFHSRQKTRVLHDRHGIPEMEKLRHRTFGKSPSQAALQSTWNRAIFDSALVQALFWKGKRV